ncbi:hypothetical protein M4578_18830 [Salipiger sp. P9]|uniref:hypothetical protein n=1 Tax=Salipiger pentaromativorans TaxID=2943193 RepID=UPI001999E614|nr:hypothetical protein [Salipiger pentaromativorans]MBD3816936.1 hypothetical protein [Halothiobacillus sp.]MCR8549888.1 hypothetical protein [Salipiger pentaromativorans]
MQTVVDGAKTPEEWCAMLRQQGAHVSARTLRAKARETGQYLSLGRAMLLNPKHLAVLLQPEAEAVPLEEGGHD